MVAIKGMKTQTDCKDCPFMATDGADELRSPMMCVALWATKHETKHCVGGRVLDDCPLVEVVTCKNCKYNDENVCTIDGCRITNDYFCVCVRRKDNEQTLEYTDQDTMMSAT